MSQSLLERSRFRCSSSRPLQWIGGLRAQVARIWVLLLLYWKLKGTVRSSNRKSMRCSLWYRAIQFSGREAVGHTKGLPSWPCPTTCSTNHSTIGGCAPSPSPPLFTLCTSEAPRLLSSVASADMLSDRVGDLLPHWSRTVDKQA